MPYQKKHSAWMGICLLLVAVMCFAALDTTSKRVTTDLPLMMAVWARYFFQALLTTAVVLPMKGFQVFKTDNPRQQVTRGCLLVSVTGLAFSSLQFMPVGEFTAIVLLTPLIVTLLAARMLQEAGRAMQAAVPPEKREAVGKAMDAEVQAFEPLWLPFDHPLWIVYSSGTTGLPKPIVHGHGGTVIVALANKILHNDVGCSYHPNSFGERFHWYSSTGWVMWNAQVAGLLNGVTCVIYDGNPGGSKDNPDWGILWRMASEEKVTFFGAGAAFFANCQKAGVDLSRCGDLSLIRALGTTGSPLSPETQSWGTEQFKNIGTDIWWCNISGGTDFAGAFVGGHRELPQEPGVMQCRMLGAAVESWNEAGVPVKGEVGELVCTQPIPSMPLFFWGDKDNARYLASYFEMYPAGHGRKPGGGDGPASMGGVWRHGDWLRIGNAQGEGEGCVIFGRSDATINRHGLRMGTSELYSAVEALPEVMDSMVVDLEYLGKESYMPLFVVLRPGTTLDDALKAKLNNAIKVALSPRFIPNEIFQVAEIPRTLSGKKQELPIKKLMLGQPLEKVVNKDAMANPGCLDWYVALAQQHLAKA